MRFLKLNCYPFVSMPYSLSLNNKINRLYERCLRIIYNDKCFEETSFEELLVKDNSVSIHHNNIYALAMEMYKVVNGVSPEIKNDVFKLKDHQTHYHLRHTAQFTVDPVHSMFGFKKQIRKWKRLNCPCRICKT